MTYDVGNRLRIDKRYLSGLPQFPEFGLPYLKWKPEGFVIESPNLEQKIVEADIQERSLETFRSNPKRGLTYVVASSTDSDKARFFCAYLVGLHKAAVPGADVVWETLTSGFENKVLNRDQAPTMLVLSNLSIISTKVKREKVRDLLEKYSSIPKVVLCVGEDPISFAATRLYTPAHCIAYFPNKNTKTVQVII